MGVAGTFIMVIVAVTNVYEIMPRNTLSECKTQCEDRDNPQACYEFCESIHKEGQPLNRSLEAYYKAFDAAVLKQ